MKVASFETNFHSLGGAQRSLLLLLKGLARKGVEVVLLTPAEGLLTEEAKKWGLSVYPVSCPQSLLPLSTKVRRPTLKEKISFPLDFVCYSKRVASFLRRWKADIFHLNSPRAMVTAGLAGRMAGIPTVLHVRGDIDIFLSNFPSGLLKFVVWALNAFIPNLILAVSKATKESFVHAFPLGRKIEGKAVVVHNAVDISNFHPSKGTSSYKDSPVIGTLSTVSPIKGLHILLQAFAKVREEIPHCRLIIAGKVFDRGYFEELLELTRRLGLSGSVEFKGFVRDTSSLLRNFDLFVLPSFTEGSPRSLLEAMAMGKPVVATKAGGIPEIIQDRVSGLLVNPGDASQLAQALLSILCNASLAQNLSQASRRRVEESFSIEKHVKKVYSLFLSLLDQSRKGRLV